MDDDFFDLPDESAQNRSATDSLLNNNIFSTAKKQAPKSIDSILASLPSRSEQSPSRAGSASKRSAVTFQDPPAASELPASPRVSSQTVEDRPITSVSDGPKNAANRAAVSNMTEHPRMQSSLMESLFPPNSSSAQPIRPATSSSTSGGIANILASGTVSSRRNRSRDFSEDVSGPSQKQFAESASDDQRNLDYITRTKEREIEELRRQLSTLRYEKTENQRTIDELHRKLEDELRDHQQELSRLNEQHKKELNELQKRHDYECTELRDESAKVTDVLRNVKQQEAEFAKIGDNFSHFGDLLADVRDKLYFLSSREDEVKSVIAFAETQTKQSIQAFEAEKAEWTRQRDASLAQTQNELTALTQKYEHEIVESRRWIESEREKLRIERIAFQEEQSSILTLIERKKEELDNHKSEFLNREHDLLIRVVNEKAILEQQRRDFEHQRNADVARLREEAQHLEQCLIQVENARYSLVNAKREYHAKQQQLNEMKSMLVEYERNRLRDK